MSEQSHLIFLADAILITHVLFVCFVVLGLVAIYLGKWLAWSWVRHRVFRIIHLVAIGIVVLQSWVGVVCPLTTWEMMLREKAGGAVYSGSFIQHWLHDLLYYSAPDWVFVVVYTVFFSLVALCWRWVRPD